MASLRSVIPRASLAFHSKQLQYRLPAIRHVSSTPPPPPKPRVLEKPDKFRAPSHPPRRATPRAFPGPPLSEHQRQQQKTKRYPHMMPPEGSFLFWFLTNRNIHTAISLSVLVSLLLGIWVSDFVYNTPYKDLLPPNSMFLAHPFVYIGRYAEIYQMHVDYTSAQTAERRKQHVEDVSRRAEYRKAHDLGQDEGIIGGWTARGDADSLGPALREGGGAPPLAAAETEVGLPKEVAESILPEQKASEEVYVDFEGKQQPVQKKWFGIW